MSFLIDVINIGFSVYTYILLARVLLSWVRHNPYNPIIKFIYEITEPVLGLFRRIIPPIGMIDISPIVAFFAVEIVRRLLVGLLSGVYF
ncbi:MAG: YggT family protein [Peptococcaceae bacterium]|nr:YggT family protein [Peptococcaceae bacterium]